MSQSGLEGGTLGFEPGRRRRQGKLKPRGPEAGAGSDREDGKCGLTS